MSNDTLHELTTFKLEGGEVRSELANYTLDVTGTYMCIMTFLTLCVATASV